MIWAWGERILGYAFAGWAIMLVVLPAVRFHRILWHMPFVVARNLYFQAKDGEFSRSGRSRGSVPHSSS